MALYELTAESFTEVDGPDKGKSFKRGRQYQKNEIPEYELHRFTEVKEAAPDNDAGPKKAKPEIGKGKEVPDAKHKD